MTHVRVKNYSLEYIIFQNNIPKYIISIKKWIVNIMVIYIYQEDTVL